MEDSIPSSSRFDSRCLGSILMLSKFDYQFYIFDSHAFKVRFSVTLGLILFHSHFDFHDIMLDFYVIFFLFDCQLFSSILILCHFRFLDFQVFAAHIFCHSRLSSNSL